jgi:hypothetical protein
LKLLHAGFNPDNHYWRKAMAYEFRNIDPHSDQLITDPNTGAVKGIRTDQDVSAIFYNPQASFGKIYFCNSAVAASGTGLTWATAFKTIAEAISVAVAGDTIILRGSFSEAVTVSVAGLTIIGDGTCPKQSQWTSVADTATLTLAANYARVENIYFVPPAYSAVTTSGPCSIKLSNANWAYITRNRFQGQVASYEAIYSPVCNSDNVHIVSNEFYYMNTLTYGAAILGVEAGGLSYSGWQIKNNVFSSCVIAINIGSRASVITGNSVAEYGITAAAAVGAVLAKGIDLSGTGSGANVVWGNQLGGTYNATLYTVGASGDQWGGNYNVLTGGVTAANPA